MAEHIWNPWHGCIKYSEGCKNCYVYRRDESIGKDASDVQKTSTFSWPLKKDRQGEYKLKSGDTVYLCMTSDFFLDKADGWRNDIWDIVRMRSDLKFMIITKRILRFNDCVPSDWGDGWDNVAICCTMEDQRACDERFPVFSQLPIKHKYVISEPLLTPIDMSKYLTPDICQVTVGGESGNNAREWRYEWILDIRRQCVEKGVKFYFKQTGANFVKDGVRYNVKRQFQHSQAKKAGINT